MADYSWKPISEVEIGDKVLSISDSDDPNALGGLPELRLAEVQNVPTFTAKQIVHLILGEGEIKTTPTHPFFAVGRGWIKASHLQAGDALLTADGRKVEIDLIEVKETTQKV